MKHYLSLLKRLLLPGILVLGFVLRWSGLDWSLKSIITFHPDEIRLWYAVNDVSWRPVYKLTQQSLERLKTAGLSENVVQRLAALQEQPFTGKSVFLAAVAEQIGNDQTTQYQTALLKAAIWKNLNPKFFAYGSLPIYLLKLTYDAVHRLHGPHANFFLVGRMLSAFWGTLTLLMLYQLGKRFFSERVALLSTTFLALTVLHIQLSHFLTVDVMLTAFVVLALYGMAGLVETATPVRYYLFTGIIIGLALATKVSASPLYGVFFGTHVLLLLKIRERSALRQPSAWWYWRWFLAALLLSGLVFSLCEPYFWLDFKEFSRQIQEQNNMVSGVTQPPYTIQYEHTTPYLYPLQQLVRHSMGVPLGMLTLLGLCVMTIDVLRKLPKFLTRIQDAPRTLLLMLLWTLPIFAIVGGFQVKFLRYMLPIIPFLCLFGALLIDRWLASSPSWKFLLIPLLVVVIGYSAWYAAAFVTIYHREDPRVQASRWIHGQMSSGATVLTESWEFAPLIGIPGSRTQLKEQSLELYHPDAEAKIRALAQRLSEGDMIILATKRLYGSILRVPDRYPLTAQYYRQLFDGELGFKPVAVFRNYPSLFGWTWNDDFADESFSVYDHPKTILLQKIEQLDAEAIYQRIMTASPIQDPAALLRRLIAFPTLESAAAALQTHVPQQASPTVRDQIVENWWAASQILLWLADVEVLALLALPLTMLIFRNLPDAGYGIAKVVGLLIPAYLVWILVNLNFLAYTSRAIFASIGLLAFVAMLLTEKFWPFFLEVVRRTWKTFVAEELIFLAVFAGFIAFRAYNPDIFWSESSMDFSFLNVLTRTTQLPPPDPWIAGETLNYYYFGHYLVATLTKLTGIPAQVTYNLAFALFPALVAMAVASLLYNLTKRYLWSVVGVVFAAFLGNLDGFFMLIAAWRTRLPALDTFLKQWSLLDQLIGKEHFYRYFRCAHEVIPYTVHEFPFWTFIFVDLHAHLLNMPFLLAVFLIGLNLLSDEPSFPAAALKTVISSVIPLRLSLLVYTLIVGTLGVISSWDYPTGVIFLLLVTALKIYKTHRYALTRPIGLWRPLWLVLLGIIPGSLLLYAPFYAAFSRSGMGLGAAKSFTTTLPDFLTIFGFFLAVILFWLAVQATQANIARKTWGRVFLGIGLLCGIYLLASDVFHLSPYFRLTEAFFQKAPLPAPVMESLKTLKNREFLGKQMFTETVENVIGAENMAHYGGVILRNAATSFGTLLFLALMIGLSAYIFLNNRDFWANLQKAVPGQWYIGLCLIYACLITAGCDVVFVRDFLQGGEYKRMNTVFKFYIPAWYLLAMVATYALFAMHNQWQEQRASGSRLFYRGSLARKLVWGGIVLVGLLFLMAAVFPVLGIHARRHHDTYTRQHVPPTLNGLAFLQATNPEEYAAIVWLNTQVTGTPVILEASKADYLYEYARISANTGLPTVLGWQSHVEQREHWGQAQERDRDVKDMYSSLDIQHVRQLLSKYQVQYIYIGNTERRDFPARALQKFSTYPSHFRQVFQAGTTVIYQVL